MTKTSGAQAPAGPAPAQRVKRLAHLEVVAAIHAMALAHLEVVPAIRAMVLAHLEVVPAIRAMALAHLEVVTPVEFRSKRPAYLTATRPATATRNARESTHPALAG